jgi:hypothetical protein
MDSKMRTLGRPFEEVNVEQFIMAIYQSVSPVDGATPASATPLSPCNAQFFVEPLQPMDHSLSIQWYVNGNPVVGQTSATFRPPGYLLEAGLNVVAVSVVDNTPRVRDPSFRYSNMTFNRSWIVQSTGAADECTCGACGDLNQDDSIDLRDAAGFTLCYGRTPFSEPLCVCADLNGDLQIDLTDFSGLIDFLGQPPVDGHPDCLE